MTDFLLELRSEEIPARMQVKAKDDLARLFAEEIAKAGLVADAIETFATPRRLALIARGLPDATQAVREETKGPKASAPPQALDGFLRKTGLTREQLEERDGVFFAVVERAGRPTADVLAEAIPAIVRAFPWPKSMRWGAASASTESLRWVRPLQGIVALFGSDIVDCEVDGIVSGAATVGHRFHHAGPITIGGAHDYVEKLRACHVIVHLSERMNLIRDGAAAAARAAGLSVIEDEGLVLENAGLTEWPVPLLGRFDAAFLDVPREVIQLTMRTNQKYFACTSSPAKLGMGPATQSVGGEGYAAAGELPLPLQASLGGSPPPASRGEDALANAFVCTANIDASDGGTAIVAGNERVLSARLSDAKFFWENDLKVPLEDQAAKLKDIVFHEKLGTVADKVERVAKLARWLCEEGIVTSPSPLRGEGGERGSVLLAATSVEDRDTAPLPNPLPGGEREKLAALAHRAALLCKADLVTGMVGEFPELQGIIGGHLARAQGLPDAVADAIRDHYKPVGQGDDVPTAPVTVVVSLADKLDTLAGFFYINEKPTGSRDPFALRRAALGLVATLVNNDIRISVYGAASSTTYPLAVRKYFSDQFYRNEIRSYASLPPLNRELDDVMPHLEINEVDLEPSVIDWLESDCSHGSANLLDFLTDRLKVQQREAGVRHDLIDAVFALGGEDDLVRLLARVRALQAFVTTAEGADLLAGYKRAANILKKETPLPPREGPGVGGERSEHGAVSRSSASPTPTPDPSLAGRGSEGALSYTPEPCEAGLIAALDSATPLVGAAIAAEDFEGAMTALSALRGPIDAFFETVTVNDPDVDKRTTRLALLGRFRDAVHRVADFSKIEG